MFYRSPSASGCVAGPFEPVGCAVEPYRVNYRAGLSNLVESLQTNELVLQQKSILVGQEAVRLEAYAALMLALGGGVVDRGVMDVEHAAH